MTTNKNAVNIINWSSFIWKYFILNADLLFQSSAADLNRFMVSHPNQKMNQKSSWFHHNYLTDDLLF